MPRQGLGEPRAHITAPAAQPQLPGKPRTGQQARPEEEDTLKEKTQEHRPPFLIGADCNLKWNSRQGCNPV